MIRWGIIGCGRIARNMAEVLRQDGEASLEAVAARELTRAEVFAAEFEAKRAYGSYEELAQDKEIDAVYIATIHPAHFAAARLCLLNGKAVLCEKPMTMNRAEAEELFRIAKERGLLLMEAIWTRFLPAWQEAKRRVVAGEIGRLLTVETDFTIPVGFDPESRMFNMEKGGGGLLDLGVYSIHTALFMLGIDIESVQAAGRLSPTGSDCYAAVTIRMKDGRIAHATCGMDCRGTEAARLMGERGTIVLPHMMGSDQLTVHRDGQPDETVKLPYPYGFAFEVEEFQRLWKAGETQSEIASPAHTLAVLGVIDSALSQICT